MKGFVRKCFAVLSILGVLSLAACGTTKPRAVTIGIVNYSAPLDAIVDGFKEGMAEAGYAEGEKVTYLYDGAVSSIDALDPAIQKLVAERPDLILALTTPAAQKAKAATQGTKIPVVFAPSTDPVSSGLVDSLTHPGGNLTGIRTGGSSAKGLSWLLAIAPGTKTLFVPHDPDDSSSVVGLHELEAAAAPLGLEIRVVEVRTAEEFTAAMDAMPADVDAIFMLPAGLFTSGTPKFVEVSIARKLPILSIARQCERGVLISYGHDYRPIGKQVARLAQQILNGTPPADLPVETPDWYLCINLQTAQAIGLDIPNDILQQADTIIR
jgi:putative ABC transport system substrate-binding protein